jgi:uncharacterized coiled-coil DUF342 family protein
MAKKTTPTPTTKTAAELRAEMDVVAARRSQSAEIIGRLADLIDELREQQDELNRQHHELTQHYLANAGH